MKPARYLRVKVLEDAPAVDDGVASVVEVAPLMLYQTAVSEVEIKEVPATLRAVNQFGYAVKEGEEYDCIQDISGAWRLAGAEYPATEIVAEITATLKSTDETGTATFKYIRSAAPFTAPPPDIGEDDEVEFVNPYDLDAMCDSEINLRRKRKEDGEEEWVLIEAKKRKARWIKFVYDSEEGSVTVDEFWEGEDPSDCGTVDVLYPLGEPCNETDVIAFYDPRTDKYQAVATEASMLGKPESSDMVVALAFDGCGINYVKQPVKAFLCDNEPSLVSTSPTLVPVDVMTGHQFVSQTSECESECTYEWDGTKWNQTVGCSGGGDAGECECGPAPTNPPGTWNGNATTMSVPCTNTKVVGLQFNTATVYVCGSITGSPTIIPINTECPEDEESE